MRAVISVSDPSPGGTSLERRHVLDVAKCLAGLAGHHQLVVTYDGDPYIRLLTDLQWRVGRRPASDLPRLDVIAADQQAEAGYLLARELHNELGGQVAAILTQVRVDPLDEAFRRPGTEIGPVCDEAAAQELAASGWLMERSEGGWRRSVATPTPLAVVEAGTIELLLDAGVVVVCAAGGIPVVADFDGSLRAVPALSSQEAAAAVLAEQIHADRLVFLTVDPDFPEIAQRSLRTVERSDVLADLGDYGPPAARRAACDFVERTGRQASIGPLWDGRSVLDGDAGLLVVPDGGRPVTG
ncbi:hypothetical protein K6U06_00690 [Acidiferrimicrobium sp. IK]|uniref:amino acid kinase family protein n=1 Tax=Acidiferrimicrobium sp. IK TaxID=2871700 RepID=UPI0021CB72EE|nr:hypothetical protein [Acidiferrimicrobium sp. IK]MCU4182863.1 hypothetical protein [Acidiferrimicrobium sp. IK]